MRTWSLVFGALLAHVASAQTTDTTRHAPGATVSGVVRDSIAHAPLPGAVVQLVAADGQSRAARTAVADSLGRFALDDVPDGRFLLGFFHPVLDSLGLEPTLREVSVLGHLPVRADLATPSPAQLRVAICGVRSTFDSGAVVAGVVRDARDRAPAAGATVTGEWLELTFKAGGVVRRIPRVSATTRGNGWFALCDVPVDGTMVLVASRGADSTDRIEVQVPPHGFLRRELYLGNARTIVRLSGSVVAAADATPLAGAQVSVAEGPRARANERGEWTLVDVPAGTRMLEVRAVGFYPERRRVDVVAGAPPIRVTLATLKSVLDTVRVTASRVADRRRSGFAERLRTGIGRYLTPADIARRSPLNTSDLFRTVPGMRLDRSAFDSTSIMMRGAFGLCVPTIFLDGLPMPAISADDIDAWVTPKDVAGIEIYPESAVPAQFQDGLRGCGSIAIWTR